jgi:predicted 2-oxoglutarate/Fe(II)-dependent dioxygenase YbiX
MQVSVLDEARSIVTVSGLFSEAECAALVGLAERAGFAPAPVTTDAGPVMASRIRNNSRVMLDDAARAADLWARVAPFAPAREGEGAVGVNERLRFYRYEEAQRFVWHRDGSYQREDGVRSHLTLMVYLNQDFYGGETVFDLGAAPIVVRPRLGMALMFEHSVKHQGAPVTVGQKYVVRTDVMYRRAR